MMNEDNAILYQQIQTYAFDQPNTCLTFGKRLARENNWSPQYTERVIAEYKKFTFLAMVAGHKVTPSEQVDQAWHLHLISSHAYWHEFCPKILGKPLHHEPSIGGTLEQVKVVDWYQKTLDSYEQLFDYSPPPDIWPASATRFGNDMQVVRVNTRQHWIIPKPAFSWTLTKWQPLSMLFLLLACLVISGCAMASPFLTGGLISSGVFLGIILFQFKGFFCLSSATFLSAYIGIGVILLLTARYYKNYRLNLKLIDHTDLNIESLAYLSGKKKQLIQTALVALVERGILEIGDNGSLTLISDAEPQTAVEEEIVSSIKDDNDLNIRMLMGRRSVIGLAIPDRLVSKGLLITPQQSKKIQYQIGLLFLPLILLGLIRLVHGIETMHPVGFLMLLLIITTLPPLFLAKPYRPTPQAKKVLKKYRIDKSVEKTLSLTVATEGITALKNTTLANVGLTLAKYDPNRSSTQRSGGRFGRFGFGGGGGGGGCGGGGC